MSRDSTYEMPKAVYSQRMDSSSGRFLSIYTETGITDLGLTSSFLSWPLGPKDPLHPFKGAWRPFEYGPRNCIGQELAMMEMKIAMVLVLAVFDIEVAYEEIDRRTSSKPKMVNGERAYHLRMNAPLPCKIMQVESIGRSLGRRVGNRPDFDRFSCVCAFVQRRCDLDLAMTTIVL